MKSPLLYKQQCYIPLTTGIVTYVSGKTFIYLITIKQDIKELTIICFSLLFIICQSNIFSQNLVPNPSFEIYTSCPDDIDQLWLCPPWQNGNETSSDYLNVCAIGTWVGIPENYMGFQEAHTGVAYGGFQLSYLLYGWPWYEYLQVQLSEPCVADHVYTISFYISLAEYISTCGIEEIGVYFSSAPPPGPGYDPINVVPQFESEIGVVDDTENWVLISGCFAAQGGEQWITIGNFSPFDSLYCDHTYYYIDDVSVREDGPIEPLDLELGDPVSTCDPYLIDPGIPGVDYHWSDGSTESTLLVTTSGTYTLTITKDCAVGIDFIEIFFEGVPEGVDLGPSDVTFCEGDSYIISLDPDIGDYEWQDGSTDPEYTITTSGVYQVSFDDGCDITTDAISVVEMELIFPDITGVPDFICENDNPISLPIVQDGISGSWSGTDVTNNTFDPSGLDGFVSITFTPDAGQCAGEVTMDIFVETLISITISGIPASVCTSDPPIPLSTLQDGITGYWSGPGVSNNSFNPAAQNGMITLTFTPDAGQCAQPAETFITVITCSNPQCEIPGYTFGGNYEGHSYYVSDETATWTEARTLAVSIGGYLATISNAGENSFVADVAALANNPEGVWIGLTDEVVEGTFDWVTGEPLIYTNWEPGEPNDLGGEDYTEIYTGWSFGTWNDLSDDWQLEYVVEFDTETCDCNDPPDAGDDNSITVCNDSPPFDLTEELGGNPDQGGTWSPPLASGGNIYDPEIDGTGVFTYTVSDSDCPSDAANVSVTVITCSDPPCEIPGYTFGGNYEGHSYYVSDAQVTWHEAKSFATSIGGHLATISNACENAFVAYVAALSNNPEGVWIGLTDEVVEGTFEWVTGEPLIYTNWAPGEPNNGLGQGEQDFGQIYIFNPLYGLWDDYFAWVDYHEYVVEFDTETCDCNDPLDAGDDNSITVCNDTLLFDLTEVLGGNPDPGGTWSPPLASGGNIYDPVIDGAGSFIYTVSASGCPSDNACVSVTVIDPIIPFISGVPSSMCEYDSPFSLSIIQDGITGNWSGPGVSNNTFDPSGIMGNVTLTFTPNPGQCAVSTTTSINVTPIVTPLITGVPESVCEISPPFTLATFQNGINGNWSGPGVSNNIFHPEDQNGIITLTFTPLTGQCAEAVQWDIAIESPTIPILSGIPSEICQTDLPIDLPTEQDGYSGIWSGPSVYNNTFDPNGWNGNLTLIFEPDDGQCAAFASTIIWVEPATTPSISGVPNSLCETEEPIQLSTYQDGIVGNWSGPGVSSNTFNPVGQNGNITLIFIPENGQCALPSTIAISVSSAIAPIITGVPASLCQSDSVLLLTGLQSGITGIWSGLHVNANSFSPSGLIGNYDLTFSPNSGQCADTTTIQIAVLTPPSFINLIAACDTMMESYTVSFEITGGDPTSYTINGLPVNGTVFTSSPILADSTNYTFTLDDINGCGPVDIQGSINCACVTYAGTMNFGGSPLKICSGSDFSVSFNGDGQLDQDDSLDFVLHDNAGMQLGTIYAFSNDTTFTFPHGIILGQTYYVSAIAGSNDGNGNINLNDQCLSVAQGIPVIFYQPQATLIGGGEICPTECITYTFNLAGEKPFVLMYQINANGMLTDHMIFTDTSTMSFLVCPADFGLTSGILDVVPISLTDANCTVALSSQPGTQILVLPATASYISDVLCPGQSLLVNGVVYDQSNPSGIEVMQNGAGCDSAVQINLSFYPNAVLNLNQTLCFGGSLTVNGTDYNETHPQGMEIFPVGSINGCDSVINIQLTFDSLVTAYFSTTLCPGESLNINGNTYDELHPTGTEFFPDGSALGCDSTLNIELLFYPEAISSLNPVLCHDEMIIINGVIYDESHHSGIEVLQYASYYGCDSTVQINLSFYPEAIGVITDTLGREDSIIVLGTVYNQYNPSGTEIIPGGSVTGCDSIIMITLFFHQSISALIEAIPPVCHGEASGEIVVEEIIGGLAPYTLILDGGSPIIVTDFPIILSGLPSDKYQIILIDASSAQLELELTIPEGPELEVDAGMDLLIPYGDNASFSAIASFPVSTWIWAPDDFLSCVDCPNPQIVNPDQNATYTLIAIDQDGCTASDEVVIKVVYENEIYLPTIFSPNGDGINDTWRIYSDDQKAELISLSILDRWGGVLFSCADEFLNDAAVEWDGTMKGKELEGGVYVFVAVLKTGDGVIRPIKGDITLIR